MKALVVIFLSVALTAPAVAQRRGGGGFGGPGRIGSPRVIGGGGFGGVRGPGFRGVGAVPRWGGRVAAWGWGGRSGWGGWGYGFGGAGFWPGWWGGGFVSGFSTPAYYSDPWPAAYPVYSYAPAPAAAPVVIINQTLPSYEPRTIEREPRYVERRERERDPDPADDELYRPITYEIAFKDGRALTALAYWVRGTALNYVTTGYEIRQAPLTEVDRARSRELNRPAGISLRLPPER